MTTILYDIPSKDQKPWSLNPWKTRMILNYKSIPYKTHWTEYPDIMPTLKKAGISPSDPTDATYITDYTCPAIQYPDGTASMESWTIAQELEKRYPTPSLHLDDPVVIKVRDAIHPIRNPLNAWYMPQVPTNVLGKDSAEYFELTRAERFGMPLSQLAERKGEGDWEESGKTIREVAVLLKEKRGPYFLGETVSYADFIFVAFLHFLKTVAGDVYKRLLGYDDAFARLYEASQQWLEKQD